MWWYRKPGGPRSKACGAEREEKYKERNWKHQCATPLRDQRSQRRWPKSGEPLLLKERPELGAFSLAERCRFLLQHSKKQLWSDNREVLRPRLPLAESSHKLSISVVPSICIVTILIRMVMVTANKCGISQVSGIMCQFI